MILIGRGGKPSKTTKPDKRLKGRGRKPGPKTGRKAKKK